jgi:hypothetical protein
MFLSYEYFTNKLSQKFIVGEDFYVKLLETVIDNPNRYTGIFRISSAKTKLLQNITQSNEIKFGDFMEDIVTDYIGKLGYKNLTKNIGADENGDILNTDQLFLDSENILYLIEQKIRDDHDSTKKRGQFQNFIKKVKLLKRQHPDKPLIGVMWFIDDGLIKNKNYYLGEMESYHQQGVTLKLYYGGELFSDLLGNIHAWNELVGYLEKNKVERSNELLHIPDFDTSEEILNALKKISPSHKRKLFSDRPQYVQLRKELFPNNINLQKIKDK